MRDRFFPFVGFASGAGSSAFLVAAAPSSSRARAAAAAPKRLGFGGASSALAWSYLGLLSRFSTLGRAAAAGASAGAAPVGAANGAGMGIGNGGMPAGSTPGNGGMGSGMGGTGAPCDVHGALFRAAPLHSCCGLAILLAFAAPAPWLLPGCRKPHAFPWLHLPSNQKRQTRSFSRALWLCRNEHPAPFRHVPSRKKWQSATAMATPPRPGREGAALGGRRIPPPGAPPPPRGFVPVWFVPPDGHRHRGKDGHREAAKMEAAKALLLAATIATMAEEVAAAAGKTSAYVCRTYECAQYVSFAECAFDVGARLCDKWYAPRPHLWPLRIADFVGYSKPNGIVADARKLTHRPCKAYRYTGNPKKDEPWYLSLVSYSSCGYDFKDDFKYEIAPWDSDW